MNQLDEFVHDSLKKIILEKDPKAFSSEAATLNQTTNTNIVESKVASISNKDLALQQKWYASGRKAKNRDFGDISPFYENATADYFFKCGYDGVKFEEAQQVLKDKIQQEIEANPEISPALNELINK